LKKKTGILRKDVVFYQGSVRFYYDNDRYLSLKKSVLEGLLFEYDNRKVQTCRTCLLQTGEHYSDKTEIIFSGNKNLCKRCEKQAYSEKRKRDYEKIK